MESRVMYPARSPYFDYSQVAAPVRPVLAARPPVTAYPAYQAWRPDQPPWLPHPLPYHELPQLAFTDIQPQAIMAEQLEKHASKPVSAEAVEKDYLRSGLVRYWGYVNELFESIQDPLRRLVGDARAKRWIKGSYTAVSHYVVVDAFDKGLKGYLKAKEKGEGRKGELFGAAEQAVDAALFQTAASLYIPALFIAVFRDISKYALSGLSGDAAVLRTLKEEIAHEGTDFITKGKLKLIELAERSPAIKRHFYRNAAGVGKAMRYVNKGIPMLASLALVPVVVHPIDYAVNKVMEMTYRPLVKAVRRHWISPES
jgi:hypothetical protein